jgi:hypothetical protein
MADHKTLMPQIRAEFEALEDSFFQDSESVRKGTKTQTQEFVRECWRRADEARDRWINKLEKRNYFIEHPGYREMWDRFNRAASMPI